MADLFETAPGSGTVAAEATPPGQPLPPNQPQPGTDSRLAGILQKKERGEALTASERGYLGSVKKRGKAKAPAPPLADNPLLEVPAQPAPVADNPLFEAAGQGQAANDLPPRPAVDSGLLRSTANALLSSLDTVTKLYVGYEAKESGADKQTVDEYKTAVALQPENRQLMVENSEPFILMLCKQFNCTPERLESVLKNSGFVGGLIAHSVGVIAAVKSIRESRKEREQAGKKP